MYVAVIQYHKVSCSLDHSSRLVKNAQHEKRKQQPKAPTINAKWMWMWMWMRMRMRECDLKMETGQKQKHTAFKMEWNERVRSKMKNARLVANNQTSHSASKAKFNLIYGMKRSDFGSQNNSKMNETRKKTGRFLFASFWLNLLWFCHLTLTLSTAMDYAIDNP